MITHIFQNLIEPRRFAHSANEETRYLPVGSAIGAIEGLLRRLRAWLAGIDRERRIRHQNAKAIAHLHSLTDGQLRDIGITRMDIEQAVRFGRDEV